MAPSSFANKTDISQNIYRTIGLGDAIADVDGDEQHWKPHVRSPPSRAQLGTALKTRKECV